MAAQHDLDLVEAVRRHRHANHVAQRVGERVRLLLDGEAIGHLDERLDCNRLQTELHYHHVIHKRVEGRSRSVFEHT